MPLPLVELAAAALALDRPPPPELARPLVAALLGADAATLCDPLARDAGSVAPGATAPDPPPEADSIALGEAEFVVVDLETTGRPGAQSTILEIGAVRVARGAPVDRFQTLIDPGVPIPPFIRSLTGIDDAMVVGAPPLLAAMRAFHAWLARVPSAPFVAHHAPFDEGFVRRALADCGLPPLARPVLCTRRLSRRLVPELNRFGLDVLCDHFTIENRARHRALGDAEATAELLAILLARARDRAGAQTLFDLLALHEASTRAAARRLKSRAQPQPLDRV